MFVCVPSRLLPGVENIFQTKDMQYAERKTGMEPDHTAMVPELVENQLHTEQVRCSPSFTFTPRFDEKVHYHLTHKTIESSSL